MEKTVKAELILENGRVFEGRAFGHIKEVIGEVVFTTGMVGYQETITDPAFKGKIVMMTYPLIGNYGINLEDMEADKPFLNGLIVREKCDEPNNWRQEMELSGFLKQQKIMAVEGIDTRAVTRLLRDEGTMKGIITTRSDTLTQGQIKQKFESFNNINAVKEVTCKKKYILKARNSSVPGSGRHVAIVDLGLRKSMLKGLKDFGCKVTVFPAFTDEEEILGVNPDVVFFSGGPGDPHDVPKITETVAKLFGKKPVMGIGLGHQLIALALGCKVTRLKAGHHGGHPVKNLVRNKLLTTSQNHEFVVSDVPDSVSVTFVSANDGTIEGIKHKDLPVHGIQFYPELKQDALYEQFLSIIKEGI